MTVPSAEGEYEFTDDPSRMDVSAIHAFLTRSYWADGISRDLVERSLRSSLCIGLFSRGLQVGFARIVTDRATFAYLCDVYVLEEHRGRGLGRRLIQAVMAHPDLQGLRRFMLVTRDGHGLYSPFGFTTPTHPERIMEIARPGLYRTNHPGSAPS
ncbi:MAG: GNAT family N-acetyltransferase [Gemmataceae bacterium]